MNGFLGADTAQLRETSALFSQRTDLLQETARHTLQLAQRVAWVGPDADGFRAESAALADRLMHIASQVGEQGASLLDHADQQDEASADTDGAGGGGGAGGGAWQPDFGRMKDLFPWPLQAPEGEDPSSDPLAPAAGRVRDGVLHALDKVFGSSNPVWKLSKKALPAIPELIGMGNDLLEGDTAGFMVGSLRFWASVTPLGWIEDASSVIFPALPDDWTYPGTDIRLNEGSLIDGLETALREQLQTSDHWSAEYIREGEQYGMEISDRLGIENQYARNAIKTLSGTAAGVYAGNLDPETGEPGDVWVFRAPMPFD